MVDGCDWPTPFTPFFRCLAYTNPPVVPWQLRDILTTLGFNIHRDNRIIVEISWALLIPPLCYGLGDNEGDAVDHLINSYFQLYLTNRSSCCCDLFFLFSLLRLDRVLEANLANDWYHYDSMFVSH